MAVAAAAMLVSATTLSYAQTGDPAYEIKIAFLSDYEHKGAFDYAVETFNGAQAAISGSNYQIIPMVVDVDGSNVVSEMTRLHDSGYKYFVGPLSSGVATVAMGYADDTDDIVLVSPSSTAASLAIPDDSLFRLVPDDDKQAPVIAERVTSDGKTHAVILYRDDPWGHGLRDSIEHEYGGMIAKKISLGAPPAGSAVDPASYAGTAAMLADEVRTLASGDGADSVAVILIGFEGEAVALVKAILADRSQSEILELASWYGTDGTTQQSGLVNDAGVAEFLHSVGFVSSKFEVSENAVNRRIAAQMFDDDASYGDNLYDAVFLLADAAIIQKEQYPSSTVRSILLDVAADSLANPVSRTPGSGALGQFTLNAAGDLASPLTYLTYGIYPSGANTYEWRDAALVDEIRIALLSDYEHKGVFSYAVDQFHAEQSALSDSRYVIIPKIVDIDSSSVSSVVSGLYNDEGYKYFVGPLTSAAAAAAKGYADTTDDIILVSPSSSAASLAIPNDSLFRLVPDDDKQAPVITDYIESQGKTHAVMLYRDDTWGHGLRDSIEREYDGMITAKISLGAPSPTDTDPAAYASHAVRAADEIQALVASHGADDVAVILIAFQGETVGLVRAILADDSLSGVLGPVSWYGTDGTALQSELVNNADVASALHSVNFVSSKFAASANDVNRQIAAQMFDDDASFGDNLYDAVFLLADAEITAAQSRQTARSILLEVADGTLGHDFHHPSRTLGSGALGMFEMSPEGDLASPLTYTIYGIYHISTPGGGMVYEWRDSALAPEPVTIRACR